MSEQRNKGMPNSLDAENGYLQAQLSESLAREQRLSARLDAVEKYARECARLRMEPSTRGLREALSSVPGEGQ